jgi:hypothetical protein
LRAVQDRILIGRNGSVLQKLLQVESSGLPGRHGCWLLSLSRCGTLSATGSWA